MTVAETVGTESLDQVVDVGGEPGEVELELLVEDDERARPDARDVFAGPALGGRCVGLVGSPVGAPDDAVTRILR